MSWTTAFGALHQQLQTVHPTSLVEVTVDRQTMVSIAREINQSARKKINPFTVDEVTFYGMKIFTRESLPVVAGDE